MKQLFVKLETGLVGSEAYVLYDWEDGVSEDQMLEELQCLANDNASMYGIYPPSEFDEELGEDDESGETISDDIGFTYEDYVPEKHDGYLY